MSRVGTRTDDAPLKLEKYAAFSAEVDAGSGIEKLLEREGLAREDWSRAQAYWLKRMADEAQRKRFDVTTRYQAHYTANRKIFEAKARAAAAAAAVAPAAPPPVAPVVAAAAELDKPLTAELPKHDVLEPPAVVAPPPGVVAAPYAAYAPRMPAAAPHVQAAPAYAAPAPALHVPSYVAQAAPPAVVVSTGPVPPGPFPQGHVAAPLPVTGPLPNVAMHAAPVMVDLPKKKQNLGATMAIDASALVAPEGAVPFRADPKKEPPAPTPVVAERTFTAPLDVPPGLLPADPPKKKPNLGATMGVDFGEVRERATPFERAAPSAPAPVAPAPASRTRADDDDDDDAPRTGLLDPEAVAIALKKAMPFGGPLGPPAASPPASAPAAALRDEKGSPKTAFFDASQLGLQPSGGLPFGAGPTTSRLPGGAGSPPPIPAAGPLTSPPKPSPSQPSMPAVTGNAQRRFSINVFASLTAEIAEQPTDVEAIRKRYGVTEAEHHDESRAWTEEFQRNDEVRQRYLGIVQRYRSYIQQRKR